MNQYQRFIHQSRYARWIPEQNRRETWEETVDRYCSYMAGKYPDLQKIIREEAQPAILNMEIMPSMRALATAGPALDLEAACGYNCAYVAVDSKRVFSEALYLLMCGCGVGFSVERQYIRNLPIVPDAISACDDIIVVQDSRAGWAKAYHRLITALYAGDVPVIDYSKVRPAGSPLKTFGGRASGPDPLKKLVNNTISHFKKAVGRRFTSLEVHDLMCFIGEIVTVGGVRRSAMISLSNLSDPRMREAKSGQWWTTDPQRALANNSVAYTEKPDSSIFLEEWLSLVRSKSGERGIFNREAAIKKATREGRRSAVEYGGNPCCEILLRSRQFCNLSEVVVRANDTEGDLARKVRLATLLGTMQSGLTHFGFISESWKINTEEERLLGVSMTGIMDNPITSTNNKFLSQMLDRLRAEARKANSEFASIIDIEESAAITCVKPSGTVSQLVDSASGIHPRYSKYYLRTVRSSVNDPLCKMMIDAGVYNEPCAMSPESTRVFYFPTKSPTDCITRHDKDAIEQLQLVHTYYHHWADHTVSNTIDVKDHEWPAVGAWVYDNFDSVCGLSFLPSSDHSYQQAPYQEISAGEFDKWCDEHPTPEIDWSLLANYEKTDGTKASQTLACTGGVCEIVDLTSS